MSAGLVERIDALLPQTQCQQCRYAGCRPYAEALARDETAINRCAPGGRATIEALAELLDRPVRPLDPDCGPEQPYRAAWIDESVCIGCTRCIQACPVDAIVGAAKLMHSVISAECTGCRLCLPPCPVDCIEMIEPEQDWNREHADLARERFEARNHRLQQRRRERRSHKPAVAEDARKAVIAAAVARTRAKRTGRRHDTR